MFLWKYVSTPLVILLVSVSSDVPRSDDKTTPPATITPDTINVDQVMSNSHILHLTNENFTKILTKSPLLLVSMYASHSEKSQNFLKIYENVSKLITEEFPEKIHIAKIDVIRNYAIYEAYSLPGTPVLFLFKDGGDKYFEFSGNRTQEVEILAWIRRKIKPIASNLFSSTEVKRFMASANKPVIGFFENSTSESAKTYLSTVEYIDTGDFAISENSDIRQEFGIAQDSIVIFDKTDDNAKHILTGTNLLIEDEVGMFLLNHLTPLVRDFSWTLISSFTSASVKLYAFLFITMNETNYREELDNFTTVARAYRGKVIFMYVNVHDPEMTQVMSSFDVSTNITASTLRAAKFIYESTTLRYIPSEEMRNNISVHAISSFIDDILEGEMPPVYRSADVSVDWDKELVKKVVGSNFNEIVKDSRKHVFITFTSSWCLKCHVILDHFKKLANDYKDRTDLLFAETDFSENEYRDIERPNFPGVKLFLKMSNKEIDYTGLATYDDIKKFIDVYLQNKEADVKYLKTQNEEL